MTPSLIPTRRTARWMASLAVVALALAPALAEAQAGRRGSVGSRGDRTYQAPPPTNTAPRGAAPVERSMTPAPQPGAAAARPGAPAAGAAAAQPARGGFMGGLAGGLLAGGLIGLMFGGGLFGAGFAGFLGALLQIGLIALLVFFVIRLFRRRAQPAGMARDMQPPASPLRGYGGAAPQPAAAPPVRIDAEDFNAFERLLTEVQDAWSRQDRDKMQRIATPEMVTILGEQIGELRAKGLTNRVRDVKLEQGDLAEAWQERGRTFATVAMRFSMVAETTDASGRVVEGGPQRQEATELWTFVRVGAGDWMLSAIQQAT